MPAEANDHPRGAVNPDLEIVVWGDYQSVNTGDLDRLVSKLILNEPRARYRFRNFPMQLACNVLAEKADRNDQACLGAKAAEAAGLLGDTSGFWTMHDWLIRNRDAVTLEAVQQQADAMGIDVAAFTEALESVPVQNAINLDASTAKAMGLRGVPLLIVNDRVVPRWRIAEDLEYPLLEQIFNLALEGQ